MKRALLLVTAAILLVAVAACANAGSSGAGVVKPTPSMPPATVTPTPVPSRGVAEIKASAPTSKYLDGVHYRAGKPCESCHGSLPATGTPSLPTPAKCLPCHGGTYDGLASVTAALADRNPHDAHPGQLACTECHHVHRAFELYCNNCHSMRIPDKFKTEGTS